MYGFEILHKNDRKVETISQKPFGSNPYVRRSHREKTGRGGGNLFKTFIKVRYTLLGKILLGKSFCWGKLLLSSQYFVTFPQQKVFPQI